MEHVGSQHTLQPVVPKASDDVRNSSAAEQLPCESELEDAGSCAGRSHADHADDAAWDSCFAGRPRSLDKTATVPHAPLRGPTSSTITGQITHLAESKDTCAAHFNDKLEELQQMQSKLDKFLKEIEARLQALERLQTQDPQQQLLQRQLPAELEVRFKRLEDSLMAQRNTQQATLEDVQLTMQNPHDAQTLQQRQPDAQVTDRQNGGFGTGKKEGQGTMSWPDGRIYEGLWKDGQPHGRGRLSNSAGENKEGVWESGKFKSTC
eukprot:gnl/TRDRNA2_/TRDRNA2_176583_c0_seq1.p1 gnl/TRDRNA2_/TRDRNA2_176583_c0~~gnl/TRDRNA2_/TRDRNA2_176583_c0_seq1.p1  ORF type:complete len:264 (-),score=55.84 gnl/TRDRNA2_/TRDRNA2_176583_c0_seq1:557-1348(-)